MMKTVVILNAVFGARYMFEKVFGGRSAYDRALSWAASVSGCIPVVVLAASDNAERCKSEAASSSVSVSVKEKKVWTTADVLDEIASLSEKAETALYAAADCPFLDKALSDEILRVHKTYAAEYTFADGYPYGFSPEALDTGAAAIIASLARQKNLGDEVVTRDAVMKILKTDINSFEIETVLAPKDRRLYRLSFECSTKAGYIASRALYDACGEGKDAASLSEKAVTLVSVLKTVPAFYNVQISGREEGECIYSPYREAYKKTYGGKNPRDMTLVEFRPLVSQMASLSESAVVSLSAWGEPLLHPDFTDFVKEAASYDGLSLLVETNGLHVTEELCEKVKEASGGKIIWIVLLDAVSEATYKKMRGSEGSLSKAHKAVALLQRAFPDTTYPQFVRTNDNEAELEAFYRFWKDDKNGGKVIIQKYDWFSGILPECKPADLSPLERNPCWHLRRDMTILSDGSVPPCREYVFNNIIGNAFTESLASIWERMTFYAEKDMKCEYGEVCGKCDEYYTFNF